jgi:hypothetical protein
MLDAASFAQNDDDDLSEFADFQLTESSGLPEEDAFAEHFELSAAADGDGETPNMLNAGEFSDDFADFMLSPKSSEPLVAENDFDVPGYAASAANDSDGMDDFEAMMAQVSAEATVIGGSTDSHWDFNANSDDEMSSGDFDDMFM